MPDAEILREHFAHEQRVLAEQPRINLVAFVRNVFDSQLLESVGFRTERDLYAYVIHLLEQRGRKLSEIEKGRVGVVTATEFHTRSAIAKITRTCASCDHAFRLDEQRYEASMAGEYAKVCAKCMGDTRGVPSSTIREQLREEGLGLKDLR
jgi:Leu/Phe-tRNA-protein transferase